MNNILKKVKNKIRHHAYSVPILGWVLRNTVGRRGRLHGVSSAKGYVDASKIALTAWALHYHPYKQASQSRFTVHEYEFARNIRVLIEVPSRKALKA